MSLKDMLKTKPVPGPEADKPSPVSQEPSSSPIPPVPPNRITVDSKGRILTINGKDATPESTPEPNNGKKVSLKEMLAKKPPVMGATDRRQQPSLVGEMEAETGSDRLENPRPISPKPVPAVVSAAPSKPSLRDLIREKTQKPAEAKVITPASQPDRHPTSPKLADEVSYGGSSLTLQDKIALAKRAEIAIDASFEPAILSPESDVIHMLDRYGRPIDLNAKQASGAQMAIDGQSFVLTGEAGTGKSTTIEAVIASLLQHHRENINDVSYRMNDRSGRRITAPSVCVCAYTRKAIGNVSRILSHNFELHAEMEGALQTIHNLLEYAPVVEWSEKQEREVRIFKPQRGQWDPLDITHLIIEEASMVGLDLWEELRAALKPNVQIIYVGDINQLPPVFGKSVMSYALTKLPIVHLDMVYRQALDNPIIAAAHAVLHGKPFEESKPALRWIKGKSKIVQPEEAMSRAMGRLFEIGLENRDKITLWKESQVIYDKLTLAERAKVDKPKTDSDIKAQQDEHVSYDPEEDVVLIPFNKNSMGTKQINYRIAQHLGEKRGAEIFEVIAGFEKHYLAVGDKVMVNKMEGVITRIATNMSYMGRKPMTPSINLTRFGFYSGTKANKHEDDDFGLDELDIDIEHTIEEEEERRQQSSHLVTCELETGQEITITSAGEFNGQIFQLGYALSIHKSQGSEWRRVFLLFHKNHSTMLSRELLYTAMTRAREELVIVARPELIKKATTSPRIKGNSLKQKIEYFNSGYLDEDIEVTV